MASRWSKNLSITSWRHCSENLTVWFLLHKKKRDSKKTVYVVCEGGTSMHAAGCLWVKGVEGVFVPINSNGMSFCGVRIKRFRVIMHEPTLVTAIPAELEIAAFLVTFSSQFCENNHWEISAGCYPCTSHSQVYLEWCHTFHRAKPRAPENSVWGKSEMQGQVFVKNEEIIPGERSKVPYFALEEWW